MGLHGAYMVLKVDDSVIAETTKVNLKVTAKPMDSTSQDSGINGSFTTGKVMVGIGGAFLYATSDYSSLYTYLNAGTQMGVIVYVDGNGIINGYGIMKKLSAKGANADENITGAYGIRITSMDAQAILTESGFELLTESGETLIIE